MARRLRLALLGLGLFGTSGVALAQSAGRVTAVDGGHAIAGATVVVLGTARAAVTDSAGRFTIADIQAGALRVQARRLGFVNLAQTVTVASGQAVTVAFALVSSPVKLEEIRTVGYGTQAAGTVTGAVTNVSAEKVKDVATSDPVKALQGRVAGVEVVANSNEPGASFQVRIRGVRSLTASNEPLYVVDGIPISGNIQDFNPSIIESFDVLKDAAATAIYGTMFGLYAYAP